MRTIEAPGNPVPAQEAAAIVPMNPLALVQTAIDKNLDVDKLDKLLAVYERWEKGEAKKKYVAAFNAFKEAPPEIVKSKQAAYSDVEYWYASLDDVVKAIVPALAKHGLSHHWETEITPNLIRVKCILRHVDGHSESAMMESIPDSSGKKNPIQSQASAVTYLQRYTLLAVTGLSATDLDDDGKSAAITKKEEAKKKRASVAQGKVKPSAEPNRGHGNEGMEEPKAVPFSGSLVDWEWHVKKDAKSKSEEDRTDSDYYGVIRTLRDEKKVDFFLWDTKFFDCFDGNSEAGVPKARAGEIVEFLAVANKKSGKTLLTIETVKRIGERYFTVDGKLMGEA